MQSVLIALMCEFYKVWCMDFGRYLELGVNVSRFPVHSLFTWDPENRRWSHAFFVTVSPSKPQETERFAHLPTCLCWELEAHSVWTRPLYVIMNCSIGAAERRSFPSWKRNSNFSCALKYLPWVASARPESSQAGEIQKCHSSCVYHGGIHRGGELFA